MAAQTTTRTSNPIFPGEKNWRSLRNMPKYVLIPIKRPCKLILSWFDFFSKAYSYCKNIYKKNVYIGLLPFILSKLFYFIESSHKLLWMSWSGKVRQLIVQLFSCAPMLLWEYCQSGLAGFRRSMPGLSAASHEVTSRKTRNIFFHPHHYFISLSYLPKAIVWKNGGSRYNLIIHIVLHFWIVSQFAYRWKLCFKIIV